MLHGLLRPCCALLLMAAACWTCPEPGGGRVVVLGSAGLLADAWLDKENNSRISDFVFRWLRPVRGGQLELVLSCAVCLS